jgi:hypothetical protein
MSRRQVINMLTSEQKAKSTLAGCACSGITERCPDPRVSVAVGLRECTSFLSTRNGQ